MGCALGIAGTIVPLLPGLFLVGGSILVWAVVEGTAQGWVTALLCCAVLGVGLLLKYLVPAKWLSAAGVPRLTLVVGGLAGVAGFFLIPVVGVIVGFIVGILVVELLRLRAWGAAWSATWAAMKASGLSMLIELTAALVATALWAVAVAVT